MENRPGEIQVEKRCEKMPLRQGRRRKSITEPTSSERNNTFNKKVVITNTTARTVNFIFFSKLSAKRLISLIQNSTLSALMKTTTTQTTVTTTTITAAADAHLDYLHAFMVLPSAVSKTSRSEARPYDPSLMRSQNRTIGISQIP